MAYVYLGTAILGELIGTNLLKAAAGFTRFWPTIGALLAYGLCFFFLSLAMRQIDLNVAYAIWAGIGIVVTTVLAVLVWHEPLNLASLLGTALVILGVVILNLYGPSH
ncbi:MAG: multidrug efflux SMR transporter [Levilactobacillus sp.]|jgi:small multidrug resistance pump|uniref:QacE family quaternary ammonium compound efflux SMR transporter n=1 Tax=Levilactobacillus suantsaiihabitans TaxID=2487722 RepID=A0A4Z0J8I2_9LACO|nr:MULTISPECIES: multidrug efflux SMR transporter [Levilactobacillus]MCI1553641.1 multidrug efflux SMR transporter [Levilactobacillus sp.]MCI1598610.1 multidrug efflux SMR transporter [Levilactobacillus sp.]MCI1605258.1 multidrug efflux SMR transporter [Levilactobacillus sp.]TGD18268.1 QacE family quaternary ammonium compound efflux SMR transporter [Levilactobacillus suantsaiihabitans]